VEASESQNSFHAAETGPVIGIAFIFGSTYIALSTVGEVH